MFSQGGRGFSRSGEYSGRRDEYGGRVWDNGAGSAKALAGVDAMTNQTRMSPLTAFFVGLFLLGATTVVSVTMVVIIGMRMAERQMDNVADVSRDVVSRLPEFIEQLPELSQVWIGTRNTAYVQNVSVNPYLVPDPHGRGLRPSVTITNNGGEPITLLTVRITARDSDGAPIAEWSEAAATPVGVVDDWRGPLGPKQTRDLVFGGWPLISESTASKVTLRYEIADLFTPSPEVVGRKANGTD